MKRTTVLASVGLAALLSCSGVAFAQSDLPQSNSPRPAFENSNAALRDSNIPNIDVHAQRFRDDAPVAVTGTVSQKIGHDLILTRADGSVLAKISEPLDNLGIYAQLYNRHTTVGSRVAMGDRVTVYGRLRKEEAMPRVIADVITNQRTGAVMLSDTADQSLSDVNLPVKLHYYSLG